MINESLLVDMYNTLAVMRDKCANGDAFPKSRNCSDGAFELMKVLNKIFTDISCLEVVLTNNTDCDFFGVMITISDMGGHIADNCDVSSSSYRLEIDSKLFNPVVGLEIPEIAALILHDIDQIVNSRCIDEIRMACDAICCGLGFKKDLREIINHTKDTSAVFAYAATEAAWRMFSICAKPNTGLVLATEFIRYNDMTIPFDSAFEKIQQLRSELDKNNVCETLSLKWFFYWVNSATKYDTLPVYTLKQALAATGSVLLKRLIKQSLEFLSGNIDYRYSYIEEASKKKSLIGRIKLDGMKSLEDDLFEYSMRVKNIDDENAAILLMRQINNRIGMIDEYLIEEELSEHDRKRWEKLYDKYDKLREEMIKKPIYSRKMYGLFVDYNALMQMNSANQMTLNTMY